MLTFTEEILLLLLDDKDGTFVPIPKATLGCALAGAVLMDLAFANRIDTDPDSLVITDRAPTGSPIVDPVLAKIAAQGSPTDARTWIRVLSVEDSPEIREQALQSLVARGIVVQREARVMWGVPRPPLPHDRRQRRAGGKAADRGRPVLRRHSASPGRRADRPGGRVRHPPRDLPRPRHGAVPPAHRPAAQDGPDRPRARAGDRRHRADRHDVPLGGALLGKGGAVAAGDGDRT